MGRTISLKLGPADADLEQWIDAQSETPSALLRTALLMLMESRSGVGGVVPAPTVSPSAAAIEPKALAAAIASAFREARIGDEIASAIKGLTFGPSQPLQPVFNITLPGQNGNGHHSMESEPAVEFKSKRPPKTPPPVQPSEPEDDSAALEQAADNFLSMFG